VPRAARIQRVSTSTAMQRAGASRQTLRHRAARYRPGRQCTTLA